MKIYNTEIKIVQGDITELKVDAIVNAANNELLMGGGVAGAIRKIGGKEIEDEAVSKGPIEIGQAIATGAGKLKAKYVIHAATMGVDFKTNEIKVRNSCKNALRVAEELKVNSVAFPALGCGVGGFSVLAAAKIMSQEVLGHLRDGKSIFKEIIFCLYNKDDFDIFQKHALGYLDYVVNKLKGPYLTVDAIIEVDDRVVVIQRKNPPFGWALPGGFVDYGESVEEAVIREMKEETDLDLEGLKQFHTYSAYGRDPRFHTVAVVFTAKGKGKPQAGDDAGDLKLIKAEEIDKLNFAFDHNKILEDYFKSR